MASALFEAFPGGATQSIRRMRHVLAAVVCLPLLMSCSGGDQSSTPSRAVERAATALAGEIAAGALRDDPEAATRLGLPDAAVPAGIGGRLTGRSQAAFERGRLRRIETLDRLAEMRLAPEGTDLRARQLAWLAAWRDMVALQAFGFGRVGLHEARPYVVDHLSGAYVEVPLLLLTEQTVANAADADAYLDRLAALPGIIQDERRRLIADAEAGVRPPARILEAIAARARAHAGLAIDGHPLVEGLDGLLIGATGLSADARAARVARARTLVAGDLPRAYRMLAETAEALARDASDVPGVWDLPQGDAYYRAILARGTGQQVDATRLHAAIARDVDATFSALQMELDTAGIADGPLRVRLSTYRQQARDARLSTEAERREAGAGPDADRPGAADRMVEVEALIAQARAALDGWLARAPDEAVLAVSWPEGLPVPPAGLTYLPPSVDGRQPGRLRQVDPKDSPDPDAAGEADSGLGAPPIAGEVYELALPGRHAAWSRVRGDRNLTALDHLITWPAFTDGWGSYGLDIASEAGLFSGDTARVDYLQSRLVTLVRALVDTGLHVERWSRDDAIAAFQTRAGLSPADASQEVDRLIVTPGEAAIAHLGRQTFSALRQRARETLNRQLDPAALHFEMLRTGPRPLPQLDRDISDWIAAQIAR